MTKIRLKLKKYIKTIDFFGFLFKFIDNNNNNKSEKLMYFDPDTGLTIKEKNNLLNKVRDALTNNNWLEFKNRVGEIRQLYALTPMRNPTLLTFQNMYRIENHDKLLEWFDRLNEEGQYFEPSDITCYLLLFSKPEHASYYPLKHQYLTPEQWQKYCLSHSINMENHESIYRDFMLQQTRYMLKETLENTLEEHENEKERTKI